jgi:hypothetical protein
MLSLIGDALGACLGSLVHPYICKVEVSLSPVGFGRETSGRGGCIFTAGGLPGACLYSGMATGLCVLWLQRAGLVMICPYSDPSGLGWWSGSTVCIPKYCNLLQGLPLGLSLSLESHALHWVFASHSILGGARPFGGRGVNCPYFLVLWFRLSSPRVKKG